MTRNERIAWPRLLAEGAAIIVSILLAFGIDAWWSERIERQEEVEALSALRTESEQNLAHVTGLLETLQFISLTLDELIGLLHDAGDEPITIPGRLLGSAISWRTSNVSTSTLNALMASGNLNLLQDKDLRARLAGLPAELQDITEDEELGRDFVEYHMSVFLARQGLAELAYANRGLPQDSIPVTVTPSSEFVGMLSARRQHLQYQTGQFPRLQQYLRDLIERIDDALEELD